MADYGSPQANALLGGTPSTGPAPVATPTKDYGSAAANALLGGAASSSKDYGSDAVNSLLGGVKSSPMGNVALGPAKPTDALDIQPIKAPVDLSGLFSGFKTATNATTPMTALPKTDTAIPPSTFSFNTSSLPDLSDPIKINNEGNALESLNTKIQKDSIALDSATAYLKNTKDSIDLTSKGSVDKYNAAVDKYQAQVDTYNKNYNEYKNRIDNYNKVVGTQNAASVYTGKSLTGSSIQSSNGQSQRNSLKETILGTGAPSWMANNPVVDSVGGAYDTLQDSIDTFAKSKGEPVSTQAGKLLTTITNFGNLLFSPVSGVIQLAASPDDPNILLRLGAQGISGFFSTFGTALKGDVEVPLQMMGVSSDLAGPISDLVSFIGQAWLGDAIHDATPIIKEKIADIQTRFTKDVITTHFPGQRIFFDASKVKDIWRTNKLLTDKEKSDILGTIGGDPEKLKDALNNGIVIGIEPRTLVTLQDKPYWSKIKSFFGIGPEDAKVLSDIGGASSQTVRGYLGAGDVHPILKEEVRAAVDEHGPDATRQALEDNLGLDTKTATKLVTDATIAKTPTEIAAAHQEVLAKVAPEAIGPVAGIDRGQPVKLTESEIAPLADKTANRYWDEIVKPSLDKGEATVISADNMKDHFGHDYNDNNHPVYSKAAFDIYERALKFNPDPTVVLTGGGPASGKTELITKDLINSGFKGILYDSNMAKYEGVVKQIEMARAAGKHVEVYGVLPNLNKARTFSIKRGNEIGRKISDATFARGHARFPETLRRLLEEKKIDVKYVHLIDTRNDKSLAETAARMKGGHERDPLAILRKLDYNEDNIKKDYARRHYDNKTGERRNPLPTLRGDGEAPRQNGTDQGTATKPGGVTKDLGQGGTAETVGQELAKQNEAIIEATKMADENGTSFDEEYSFDETKLLEALDKAGLDIDWRSDTNEGMISVKSGISKDKAAESIVSVTRGMGIEVKTTNGNDLILYHGTTERNISNIMKKGMNEGASFSPSSTASAGKYMGAGGYGKEILTFHIDPRDLQLGAAGYFYSLNGGEKPVKEINTLNDFNELSRTDQEVMFPTLSQELQQEITGLTDEDLGKNETQLMSDILSGKTKIQIPQTIKSEVIKRIGQGNYMRIFRTSGNYSSLDEIAGDNGYKSDEALLDDIAQGLKDRRAALQGGFINPAKMVEDIVKGADAKIKDFIENTMEPIKVSDNLSDDFAKLEGSAQADLEMVNKLVENTNISKKDDEALYTHAENPNAPLTEHQAELEKTVDQPLKRANAELYKRIKDLGMDLPPEDNYISRFPKEKPSVLQRIFSPVKGRSASAGQGGVLSKSAPSLKKRTMKILTDEEGNRTVVSIKDGEVTAFKNKEPESMGPLKAKISPKVREWYDQNVMPKIEQLAKDLGIDHTRMTTKLPGKGPRVAGVSYTGQSKVATRAATPERVLLHEIGHQLDERYGLQELFKKDDSRNYGKDTMQSELRAVADLRIQGMEDVKKSFKSYIRKGEEKIAAMFEAYLHVPESFEEVAPNLFERFEEFLGAHKELKPILELKPSIVLGMRDVGGDLLRGKSGRTFVDKNGKKYTVGEATTQEIEQHTNLEYHHSALASRLMQYVKLRQIDRANQFLESWKASKDFAKIAVKSDEIPPEGWKMTSQMNFRNYFFEPRTAEVLDDMQNKMQSGMYNDAFQGINRVLADAIFFNGIAHPVNVAVTWAYNRGLSSLVLPSSYKSGLKSFARALKAMQTKNSDYTDLLKNGAHLMSSDVTNKKLAENLMKKLGDDLDKNPDLRDKIIKALGFVGKQANLRTNIIYKISHDMAWLSNDLLTIQSIYEAMDRYKMTMPQAIKEVSKFIPDYRQQSRLLDKPLTAIAGQNIGGGTARFLAKNIMYNRLISMFGSYHVGLLQSFNNAVKDTFSLGKGFDSKSNASRARGFDKLAMLALLGLVVWPYLDKQLQNMTGNKNTYLTRSGILKYPYLAYKFLTGQTNLTSVTSGVITPAVGTQTMTELFFNKDLFTGNPIYGIGGEGLSQYLMKKVAPAAEISRMASDALSPGDFALAYLGIHTPKNKQSALDLNNMIYNEKPLVARKMKALIAGGDTVGAQTIGHSFNTKLSGIIKEADIDAGNSGSDARIQFFLNQYGVKMPGVVAMTNYNAKQGQNIVDKTLPNGKPVIVKGTPISSQSVIGTVVTYAKALGTDPITAFKDIFSGQTIKAVSGGTIIVNRMSLAQSQADKADLAGGSIPKGMILDHIVPLEAGGTNDTSNLQLITSAQDGNSMNQPIEDFIGKELSSGGMTGAQAREISIRFKAGAGQQLTPELMKEYQDKYGGKPLTAAQVYDFKNNLDK